MRRNGILVTLTIIWLTALASPSLAANHVRIDTMSFVAPGKTACTIGVYVENDIPIVAFTLPLEIRTWSGGAYMAGGAPTFKRELNPAGRMNLSPLGAEDPGGMWPAATITNATFAVPVAPAADQCNRRIAGDMGNRWGTAAALPDFVSPDAVLMATVSQGDPNIGQLISMDPGSDPAGVPSYHIICNIGNATGKFIIDTTCRSPANHLVFVDTLFQPVVPTFEHGTIGVNVIISGVKELETGVIPQDYALEQNYPNPFNAGTVIRFQQPTDGNVKIDVYNILGRKVRTLVDEFRVAGTHQTDWNGRSDDDVEVATGVYFYRITTVGFTSTRKMVLLK